MLFNNCSIVWRVKQCRVEGTSAVTATAEESDVTIVALALVGLQAMVFWIHVELGPSSTTSICCKFVRRQVEQQAMQRFDILICEFVAYTVYRSSIWYELVSYNLLWICSREDFWSVCCRLVVQCMLYNKFSTQRNEWSLGLFYVSTILYLQSSYLQLPSAVVGVQSRSIDAELAILLTTEYGRPKR